MYKGILITIICIVFLTSCSSVNEDYQLIIDKKNSEIEELKTELQALQEEISNASEIVNESSNCSCLNFVSNYYQGKIGMGYNPSNNDVYSNLKIIGYGEFDNETHDVVDLSGDNIATLKIDISGTLYNFVIGIIKWNSDSTSYEVTEEIARFDVISNTDILFNSILAEGIPPEIILWEDINGKKFSYLIGDTGLSGNTYPYIIISELLE